MFVIPPWMNLLMTQQHLPQESAAPGSPAAPPRCQSGPPLVSAGGSWHQRGAGFPSLKAPQTPHVRPDKHLKIVLLRFQCFFLYEVPCGRCVPHLPITEIRQHSPNTGTCTRKHIHYRKTGNIQHCCTTAWLTHSNVVLLNLFVHEKTDNVPSRSLWLKATPEWGCTAPHLIRTAWNHQGQQMSKK